MRGESARGGGALTIAFVRRGRVVLAACLSLAGCAALHASATTSSTSVPSAPVPPPAPLPPPSRECDPALHAVVLYQRAFESTLELAGAELPTPPVRWRALVVAARLLPGQYEVSGDPRLEYCMSDSAGLWVVYDPRGVRSGPPVEASCGPIGAVDVCFTVEVGEARGP